MRPFHIVLAVLSVLSFCAGCSDGDPGPTDERCSLEPDPGPCEAAIPQFYFDEQDGTCKEFTWGGCDGTAPFDTLEECKSACE